MNRNSKQFGSRASGGSISSGGFGSTSTRMKSGMDSVHDLAGQIELRDKSEVKQDWLKKNFEVTLAIVNSLQGQIEGLDDKIKVLENSSVPGEISKLRSDVQNIHGLLCKLEDQVAQHEDHIQLEQSDQIGFDPNNLSQQEQPVQQQQEGLLQFPEQGSTELIFSNPIEENPEDTATFQDHPTPVIEEEQEEYTEPNETIANQSTMQPLSRPMTSQSNSQQQFPQSQQNQRPSSKQSSQPFSNRPSQQILQSPSQIPRQMKSTNQQTPQQSNIFSGQNLQPQPIRHGSREISPSYVSQQPQSIMINPSQSPPQTPPQQFSRKSLNRSNYPTAESPQSDIRSMRQSRPSSANPQQGQYPYQYQQPQQSQLPFQNSQPQQWSSPSRDTSPKSRMPSSNHQMQQSPFQHPSEPSIMQFSQQPSQIFSQLPTRSGNMVSSKPSTSRSQKWSNNQAPQQSVRPSTVRSSGHSQVQQQEQRRPITSQSQKNYHVQQQQPVKQSTPSINQQAKSRNTDRISPGQYYSGESFQQHKNQPQHESSAQFPQNERSVSPNNFQIYQERRIQQYPYYPQSHELSSINSFKKNPISQAELEQRNNNQKNGQSQFGMPVVQMEEDPELQYEQQNTFSDQGDQNDFMPTEEEEKQQKSPHQQFDANDVLNDNNNDTDKRTSNELVEIRKELVQIVQLMKEELDCKPTKQDLIVLESMIQEQLEIIASKVGIEKSELVKTSQNGLSRSASRSHFKEDSRFLQGTTMMTQSQQTTIQKPKQKAMGMMPLVTKQTAFNLSCLSCNQGIGDSVSLSQSQMIVRGQGIQNQLGKYGVELQQQQKPRRSVNLNRQYPQQAPQQPMLNNESRAKKEINEAKNVVIQVTSPCSFNFYPNKSKQDE